jgi:hypothetical protein
MSQAVSEQVDFTEGLNAPQPLTTDQRGHVLGTDTSSLYADRPDGDVAASCADSPCSWSRDEKHEAGPCRRHAEDTITHR